MNTIQILLELNKELEGKLLYRRLQELKEYIDNIRSPRGHRYCLCIESFSKNSLIVEISYPLYYAGTIAYIVSSNNEAFKVQKHFCRQLSNEEILFHIKIKLLEVNIAFTYMMDSEYDFSSFRKVFQVLSYVYNEKKLGVASKAYYDGRKFRVETIRFVDKKSFDKNLYEIIIYNQLKHVKDKSSSERDFKQIVEEYRDLNRKVRIEVLKRMRIKEKNLSFYEFGRLQIFNDYLSELRDYVLNNLLDKDAIIGLYNDSEECLTKELLKFRRVGKINYENFILQNKEIIYDYKIIRAAIVNCIQNVKTREAAITQIRKILRKQEKRERIIIMETSSLINDIRKTIKYQYYY